PRRPEGGRLRRTAGDQHEGRRRQICGTLLAAVPALPDRRRDNRLDPSVENWQASGNHLASRPIATRVWWITVSTQTDGNESLVGAGCQSRSGGPHDAASSEHGCGLSKRSTPTSPATLPTSAGSFLVRSGRVLTPMGRGEVIEASRSCMDKVFRGML